MHRPASMAFAFAAGLALAGGAAMAQPDQHHGGPGGGRTAPRIEPHTGPSGYQRVTPPTGWNNRPTTVDRGVYQHNFQAEQTFHIGPYHPPRGWNGQRWVYGQILPRGFWAAPYILADYWLFSLEVPPVGCEWVRSGDDALLVDTNTGEILQVEYGVFA
jgi:Ni/Co efflux regulator RcnB